MRLKGSHITAVIILGVCVLWIGSGVLTKSFSSDADKSSDKTTASPYISVSVIDSVAKPVVAQVKLTGTTVANRKVEIKAETSGRVVEVLAKRGQHMRKGETILQLSEDDRAAKLRQAQSLFNQRTIEYRAASRLSSKAFTSKVSLATARADLDNAAANLAAAKLDLDRAAVKAPFDGILDTRPVNVGDYLSNGGLVATLVDLDPLEVDIQVAETRISRVREGSTAKLTMPDNSVFTGVITYISSASESATRTFRVKIALSNPDLIYGDGMTVKVDLPLEKTDAHFITPAVLTLSEAGEVGINTVDETDHVVFYPVDLVREDDKGLWVNGKNGISLPQTLRLITIGQEYVKVGQKVSPKPDTFFFKNPA